MTDNVYIGSKSADDFKQKRISLLRQLEDPRTIRRLERMGVRSGWRCLEVGAGDGSIARWLADRVGPAGRVVATDVDLRLLRARARANLDVRQDDILTDELEREHYDLVHCRTLLMHLSQPERALERMVAALRPGGRLLVEETDFLTMKAADGGHPDAAAFDRIIHTINKILLERDVVDTYFGRGLRVLVERLDLADVGHEAQTRVVRGGEPAAVYHRMNFGTLVQPYLRGAETVQKDDFDTLARAFDDPTFYFVDRTVFAVWGRAV